LSREGIEEYEGGILARTFFPFVGLASFFQNFPATNLSTPNLPELLVEKIGW
jgi:hypothetical protein